MVGCLQPVLFIALAGEMVGGCFWKLGVVHFWVKDHLEDLTLRLRCAMAVAATATMWSEPSDSTGHGQLKLMRVLGIQGSWSAWRIAQETNGNPMVVVKRFRIRGVRTSPRLKLSSDCISFYLDNRDVCTVQRILDLAHHRQEQWIRERWGGQSNYEIPWFSPCDKRNFSHQTQLIRPRRMISECCGHDSGELQRTRTLVTQVIPIVSPRCSHRRHWPPHSADHLNMKGAARGLPWFVHGLSMVYPSFPHHLPALLSTEELP